MKLAPLLANYLSVNKRLELPGLGIFTIDPYQAEDAESRHGKPQSMVGVNFESKPGLREAPDLVQFISTQTGKIRALAAADLDSHLGLAQQFLNIGKPFLFEGIGSLVKTRSGEFVFASGANVGVEFSAKEISSTSSTEESFTDYNNVLSPRKKTMTLRKPFAAFLVVVGLGLAVWGGYVVYTKTMVKKEDGKTSPGSETTGTSDANPDPVTVTDTTQSIEPVNTQPGSGELKFVLETAGAKRAIPRYNKLKSYQWRLQLETRDSVTYKLFLMLPVAAADTTHILDSLSALYGKRAWVESTGN